MSVFKNLYDKYSERYVRDLLEVSKTVAGVQSVQELDEIFQESISMLVRSAEELVAPFDAFDVIELLRMKEFPMVPDPRIINSEGAAIHIELIASILLSRGFRKPSTWLPRGNQAAEAVEELHYIALQMVAITTSVIQAKARIDGGALSQLTADYQTSKIGISNFQFDGVREDIDSEIFSNDLVKSLMEKFLGYSFPELLSVRHAIRSIGGKRMTTLRDETADIVAKYESLDPREIPVEEFAKFEEAFHSLCVTPGNRAAFTAEDIEVESGIDISRVEMILSSHSQEFDASVEAKTRVLQILSGDMTFQERPLLRDEDGYCIAVANEIGSDSLRRVFESAINGDPKAFRRYDQKVRAKVSEKLAVEHISRILGAASINLGFEYYSTEDPSSFIHLSNTAEAPWDSANLVESDALLVLGDIAVVVEVKAKSISVKSRRGNKQRMATDLKDLIRKAASQATRLKQLIEVNGGVWDHRRKWVDLSVVREVYSIIALLDDTGPAAIQTFELQESGLIDGNHLPWIVSLHDLAVIAELIDQPEQFLTYLRTRTSATSTRMFAVDELDLFTAFLDGDLFKLAKDADKFRRVPLIGSTNGPIDVWIRRHELPVSEQSSIRKPELNISRWTRAVVRVVAESNDNCCLTAAVDLLEAGVRNPDRLDSFLRRFMGSQPGNDELSLVKYSFERGNQKSELRFYSFGSNMKVQQTRGAMSKAQSANWRNLTRERTTVFLFDHERNFIEGFCLTESSN